MFQQSNAMTYSRKLFIYLFKKIIYYYYLNFVTCSYEVMNSQEITGHISEECDDHMSLWLSAG